MEYFEKIVNFEEAVLAAFDGKLYIDKGLSTYNDISKIKLNKKDFIAFHKSFDDIHNEYSIKKELTPMTEDEFISAVWHKKEFWFEYNGELKTYNLSYDENINTLKGNFNNRIFYSSNPFEKED